MSDLRYDPFLENLCSVETDEYIKEVFNKRFEEVKTKEHYHFDDITDDQILEFLMKWTYQSLRDYYPDESVYPADVFMFKTYETLKKYIEGGKHNE